MFKKVIADKNGIIRALPVPAGMVNENIVKEQKTIAHDTLPGIAFSILFLQQKSLYKSIYDIPVPKMAFDRTCLIGDTFFVVRLHTAASTSKVVKNCSCVSQIPTTIPGRCNYRIKNVEVIAISLG